MKKIVLALGDRKAEELISQNSRNATVVGITTHTGGVYDQIEASRADILVIRDNLSGDENILQVLFKIRGEYPDLQIIVLAYNRYPGDPLLASLVNYGIHNILYGEEVNLYKVINLFDNPMGYKDVQHLHPMASYDDELGKLSFQPPTVKNEPNKDGPIIVEKPVFTEKQLVITKHTRQAIISCWGIFPMLGSSTMALNLAMIFAKNSYRTILVEFDNEKPCFEMWLGLGKVNEGVDTVVNDISNIDNVIINPYELLSNLPSVIELNKPLIKKLPQKLDILLFSEDYAVGRKIKTTPESDKIRELLSLLVFHKGYDIVILDLPSNLNNEYTKNALWMSNFILNSIVPDYSVIAYTKKMYDDLEVNYPGLLDRIKLVLNQNQDDFEFSTHFLGKNPDYFLPLCLPLRKGQAQEIYLPAAVNPDCRDYISCLEVLANDINPINLINERDHVSKGIFDKLKIPFFKKS